MLVGASRAVLGAQGVEIEWTAGMGPRRFSNYCYRDARLHRMEFN